MAGGLAVGRHSGNSARRQGGWDHGRVALARSPGSDRRSELAHCRHPGSGEELAREN